MYLPNLLNVFAQLLNVFVQITKCNCPNCWMYWLKLHNVVLQIARCICPNWRTKFSKLLNVFVQISKCIWPLLECIAAVHICGCIQYKFSSTASQFSSKNNFFRRSIYPTLAILIHNFGLTWKLHINLEFWKLNRWVVLLINKPRSYSYSPEKRISIFLKFPLTLMESSGGLNCIIYQAGLFGTSMQGLESHFEGKFRSWN